MHIDTGWKFKEMYDFRDRVVKENNLDFIIYKNIIEVYTIIRQLPLNNYKLILYLFFFFFVNNYLTSL